MKKTMIALALFSMCACQKREETPTRATAIPVEVAKPIVKEVMLTHKYPGYLDSDATIPIVGRVNGVITSRSFTDGSRVKKGDLLFVIEPALYEYAVAQAKAELKTAEAELEYAKSNYERMEIAIGSNAVSQIELLQAKSRVESGVAAVENSRAALNSAKTKLGYCYIKAPADGIVGQHNQPVGAYIAGEVNPIELCRLYKDDIMYIYFNVTNGTLPPTTSEGLNEVTFTIAGEQPTPYTARIDYIAPDVNLNTGTMQIRAHIDNKDGMLKPGSYINVVLPYKNIENAVLVSDAAIGTDQLGKYIYVVNDSNYVEYRRITADELVDDSLRLITEGLSANERYVTKALLKVRNGMKVTPIME